MRRASAPFNKGRNRWVGLGTGCGTSNDFLMEGSRLFHVIDTRRYTVASKDVMLRMAMNLWWRVDPNKAGRKATIEIKGRAAKSF